MTTMSMKVKRLQRGQTIPLLAALVLILGLVLAAGQVAVVYAVGTQYYVSTSGNDANDCLSSGAACQTIQAALGKAGTGDTINVAAGVYTEPALSISQADLSIIGVDQATVIINATGAGSSNNYLTVSANNVTLQEITIDGMLPHYTSWPPSKPYYGINISGPNVVNISDVTVKRFGKSGLNLNGANGVTLTRVTSQDNGGAGFFLGDAHNVTFTNITTSNNQWGGVAIGTWGRYYPPAGTDHIQFLGTNSFGEATSTASGYQGGLYLEEGNYNDKTNPAAITYSTNPADSADVTLVPGDFTYTLHGPQDDGDPVASDGYNRIRFYATQADAVSAALQTDDSLHVIGPGHFLNDGRYIKNLADGSFYVADGMSIQAAIDAASAGDTINVAAGTYEEQIDINKDNLVLQGAGQGSTIIQSPTTLATKFTTSAANKPIVYVHNATGVTIKDLTVDGAGRGNGNSRFEGIAFYNAGGTVQNTTLTRIRETPLSGSQSGTALYAYNQDGAARSLMVTNNTIDDYQKNGMALNGGNLTATVTGNTVTGAGNTPSIAQNGIQIGYGAVGTIDGNTVADNFWTGTYGGSNDPSTDSAADGAAGILLYQPGNTAIEVANNTLTGNQFGIWTVETASIDIHDNTITGAAHDGSGYPTGIAVWTTDQWGSSEVGTTGSITGNTLATHDYGLLIRDYTAGGAVPSVEAHFNNITGSSLYGAWSDAAFNAENNWWGDASGPDDDAGVINGSGDKISTNVDADPWLGADVANVASQTGSGTVSTSGVSATFTGGSATITLAEYTGNPSSVGTFGSSGSYYDVNVSGSVAGDSLEITMAAGGSTGNLYYYDGAVWKPVIGQAGVVAPSGTAPNDVYTFVLDNTGNTQPKLNELTGTPFTGADTEIRLTPSATTLAAGETLAVAVEATSLGLYGVDVSLNFNATNLEVTNVVLGSDLAADVVAVNTYDNGVGTLRFAYSQKAPTHSGNVVGNSSAPILLATITFHAKAAGASPTYLVSDALSISSALFSDKDGAETTPGILDDASNPVALTINPSPRVYVDIALQGRTSVAATSGASLEMKPTTAGSVLYSTVVASHLEIDPAPANGYDVRVDAPKYLAAEQTVTIPADAVSWDLNGTVKDSASGSTLTLRGGDLNDDDVINIQDLVLIGVNFGTSTASADINDDGTVNIQDLAIAAGNFSQTPGTAYSSPW